MATPTELLIDWSFYESQLQILQRDPDTRIVGSIGRIVACQEILGRPYQEFEDRHTEGINQDIISDIDVIGTSMNTILAAGSAGDAKIDDLAFRDTDVLVDCEDGDWFLRSFETGFQEEINPRLMEPTKGLVDGIEIVTLPLLTHKALHTLRDRGTRKYRITEQTMGYLIHSVALKTGTIPRLEATDLKPFLQLKTLLSLRRHNQNNSRHSGVERHSE